MSDAAIALLLSGARQSWPEPTRRPLPPFDMSGPYTVHTTLPFTPPRAPDRRFWRGNAWSVTVPNLPYLPGLTSSKYPERMLTWALPEYCQARPDSFNDAMRAYIDGRGYTHILQSRGGITGGFPPSFYARFARRLKDAGLWVAHMLTSKDTDAHSQPAEYYIGLVRPYLDALLEQNAVDKLSPGWELNLFWDPVQLQRFIDWLRQYLSDAKALDRIDVGSHFSTYVTSWQFPGEDRDAYWNRNRGFLTELWYQTDPWVNLGTMQAHGGDVLKLASGLEANGVRAVGCEVCAAAQFDGPTDEDEGDMYGFGLLCTPPQSGSLLFTGGYNNGARWPDGRWL